MASVLRYWHAIEMFDPQGIPGLLSRRELAEREPGSWCVETVPFLAGEPVPKLPWQAGHPRYAEPPKDAMYGSEWRYVVYGGVFSFGVVRQVIAERLGFTEPEDFAGTRKEGTESALFAFTVDQRGLLLDGTGAFSSCAWASGRLDGVRRGQRTALEGFEKVSGECQAAMERLLAKPVQYPRSLPARVAGGRREGREATLHQKNGDGWLASVADVLGGAAEGAVAAVLAALAPALGRLGAGSLTGAANAAIAAAAGRAKRAVGGVDSGPADVAASEPPQADDGQKPSNTPAGDSGSPPANDGSRPIEAFDIAWFGAAVADILKLPSALRNYLSVRVVSYPVEKRWDGSLPDPEPVFLSSMIASDLERVADTAVHGYGDALKSYLSESVPPDQRVDLRAPGIRPQLRESVAPAYCPPGRWPAAPAEALVLSQQFAVNAIVAQLASHSGLFAVNGPPGTGKTTLLRDLVAAILVARAAELAKLERPSQAFVRRAYAPASNDTTQWVLGPRDELTGFEIVVASSNNAAVENVTRELPARRTLGEPWQATADYFAGQASTLLRKKQRYDDPEADQEPGQDADLPLGPARPALDDAWGLVAVPLGNSKNRKRFCGWFWRARTGLRAHLESLQKNGGGQAEWDAARKHFQDSLRKAGALAPSGATPDLATWAALAQSEQEKEPLWSSGDDWLAARAEVFLAALDLHRALVTALAKTFRTNLELLARTLAREPGAPPADAEYATWQTLFLLIPVVSTTFASCGRLFASLGCESLGWALIDEAGQALPQAAVGTLWRVGRAVVVGDPRQLQPISQVPAEVQKRLTPSFGVSDELWRPANGSTQALADRRSVLGTIVPTTGEPVWVGAPLRVHRRCEQPMFDMSNALAYGEMMVYGTREEQFPSRPLDAYPGSCWIDVTRRDGTGKWVPAQGEALLGVLRKLRDDRFGVGLDQVHVLSPFRDVVTECRKKIGAALRDELVPGRTRVSFTREHIGTVHSMQGREADVVIFILGTDRSASGRARQWVGNPPNLLNVAVSRARRRLFVIGRFSEWTDVPSFDVFDTPARFPRVRFD
jgi:AAA domain-containing protein